MTQAQCDTVDRFVTLARESGAVVTVDDQASPGGPLVMVEETLPDGTWLAWEVLPGGDAQLIANREPTAA